MKEKKVKDNKQVEETDLFVPLLRMTFHITVLDKTTLWWHTFFFWPLLYIVPVRVVVHSAAFQL